MSKYTKLAADGSDAPTDASDHVAIRDNATGLIWSVKETKELAFKAAKASVKKLSLLGHNDWRLPTVQELLALVDYEKHGPAIDANAFPKCKSSWYWTSSPAAGSPDGCAWVVGFGGGSSGWGQYDDRCYVRAVRAGQ